MSMNLYVYGRREIKIVETGKYDFQTEVIHVCQTPTETTNEIIKSPDPINSYFDWIQSGVYNLDDAKRHILETKTQIQKMENEGYEIYFEEI